MELPKLYGLDSKGEIKEWSVEVVGAEMIVRHGKLGGKIQEKRTTAKAKNVGRANETTPEEQAQKEAKAKWTKQKDKSYCEDKDQIEPLKNPMLAHDFHKQGHRIKFPCDGQPKLDGVRCLASMKDGKVVFKSRGGKEYQVPPHLQEELQEVFMLVPDMILDGEIYKHGLPLNEISSAIKKPNDNTSQLEFWIFDLADESLGWPERYDLLTEMYLFEMDYVHLVDTVIVHKPEDAHEYHDVFVEDGYEGIMLRNLCGAYRFDHRSADLQKLKIFKDAEYEIVEIYESTDGLGMFRCLAPDSDDPDDKTFGVTPAWSHARRKAMLDEPQDFYVGKMLTVKYQQMTKHLKPQFGTGVNIREEGE